MAEEFERPVLYVSRDTMMEFRRLIGAPPVDWTSPKARLSPTLDILFDDRMPYGEMRIEEAPVGGEG